MATIHHICDNCGSDFSIKYDEMQCEDDPHFCSFCGEYMVETDTFEDEDE